MSDLVHNPALFDSRAWLHITNAIGWADYQALAIEIEAPPRANHATGEGFDKAPVMVKVSFRVTKPGRTGPRRTEAFESLTQAIKYHGRKVRSSLESGKPSGGIMAELVHAK